MSDETVHAPVYKTNLGNFLSMLKKAVNGSYIISKNSLLEIEF